MTHNNFFDLRQMVSGATSHVFSTMLSMKIQDAANNGPVSPKEERVVASVGFGGGGLAGGLTINVTNDFAKAITAAMLALEPEQIQNPSDVNDVLGELANVIGGNCLAAFSEQGYTCALSLPCVTRGVALHTDTVRGAKRECVSFQHGPDRFYISLDLKPV